MAANNVSGVGHGDDWLRGVERSEVVVCEWMKVKFKL